MNLVCFSSLKANIYCVNLFDLNLSPYNNGGGANCTECDSITTSVGEMLSLPLASYGIRKGTKQIENTRVYVDLKLFE